MAAVHRSFSIGVVDVSLKPAREILSLAGTRALAYSHVAVELLRRQLFHQLGEDLARSILAQAGRHAGFNEAQLLLQEREFPGFDEMVEAQFALLAASGFGRFEVLDLAFDGEERNVYVRARCSSSPEAESHRRLFGASKTPACCHLVGYMAGWTSSMTGLDLLTVEARCVAKGDPACEFETMPYADFSGPEATFWKHAFESTSESLVQRLQDELRTTHRQMETIREQRADIAMLSSPVLQIADDLLVLPVIGAIDIARSADMSEALLGEIVHRRAKGVVIDVTGIATIDTDTIDHFLRMVGAVRLLGARAVLTGISPRMSQMFVAQGVELGALVTRSTLQEGIGYLERGR